MRAIRVEYHPPGENPYLLVILGEVNGVEDIITIRKFALWADLAMTATSWLRNGVIFKEDGTLITHREIQK